MRSIIILFWHYWFGSITPMTQITLQGWGVSVRGKVAYKSTSDFPCGPMGRWWFSPWRCCRALPYNHAVCFYFVEPHCLKELSCTPVSRSAKCAAMERTYSWKSATGPSSCRDQIHTLKNVSVALLNNSEGRVARGAMFPTPKNWWPLQFYPLKS